MKYSTLSFNENARKHLLAGATKVERAVGTTLGARGRNVVIQKDFRTRSIHDGVKVAQEVRPKNQYEAAGAEILKQAAQRTVDVVGDGTTATIVLAHAIAKEALKVVESGVNPMALRSSLEKGRDLLVKEVEKLAKPVSTKREKVQIATISAEDEQLGSMIGETYHKAGVEAIITAESVAGPDTFLEHEEGMQIDSGYKSEYFVTNPQNMTATITKSRILITDYKLDNIYDLVPLLNNLVESGERNLVVLASDIEGNVLATLISNKMKGQLNTLAIKIPSYQAEKVLQDIAVATGGKFISSNARMDLKKLTVEDLGYAERVTATRDATIIVGGGGDKDLVEARITALKDQLKEEADEFQREKLRERLARMTGGVYVINVGGHSEVEADEKRERAEDAILATRAAINEGIVPGGETVYLHIKNILEAESETEDYAYRILKRALHAPFNRLVENAGLDSGEMYAEIKKLPLGEGVDVTTGKIVDLYQMGIIDPAAVSISAIRNAVSVAISLITSDAIIVERDDN